MGKVILVGAGPGDPGLLSLKGKEYLASADCIIYDRLASTELLSMAPKNCELIYVGKENHHHTMKQEEINELLLKKAGEKDLVVRLKGGDPYVFGRGGEEALFLTEHGVKTDVVSGVSSVTAVLADAGIPITHRGLSKGFCVITAHSRKDQPAEIDYGQLTDPSLTLVFMMGLAHVAEIAEGLIGAGRNPETKAAVISCGTTPYRKKCLGTLADIASKTAEAGLVSPALIVVGDAVGLSQSLDFYEKKPLSGKKYVFPYIEPMVFDFAESVKNGFEEKASRPALLRKENELIGALSAYGAEVRALKIGEIIPIPVDWEILEPALSADWLLFTSKNGVNAFLWNLRRAGLDIRAISHAKLGAVGNKTKAALAEVGLIADLVPETQTGRTLAKALLRKTGREADSDLSVAEQELFGNRSERAVLFAAKESNPEVEELLSPAMEFEKVVCYENREALPADYEGEAEKSFGPSDGIIFTSASSVERYFRSKNHLGWPDFSAFPEIYTIGPKCSEALETCGIREYTEAQNSSYDGILRSILQ